MAGRNKSSSSGEPDEIEPRKGVSARTEPEAIPPRRGVNKADLSRTVGERLGSHEAGKAAVDAVLDAIVRAVVGGERVSITGFGSFEKVNRPARYARNPQTGEGVRVKKTSVPRFRAGQGFKDLVSGSKKLPKVGEASVKKAPKGSRSGVPPAAPRTAGKKAAAKKTTTAVPSAAKKTTVTSKKAAPAKKTSASAKGTAKKGGERR